MGLLAVIRSGEEPAQVLGGLAVGGSTSPRVVLREHLGAVALALSDGADVEP
jgi:hypothetical protein